MRGGLGRGGMLGMRVDDGNEGGIERFRNPIHSSIHSSYTTSYS